MMLSAPSPVNRTSKSVVSAQGAFRGGLYNENYVCVKRGCAVYQNRRLG